MIEGHAISIDKREQYTQAKKECRSLDLESFLIKPVQRVCKYPLLLRELERATEPDHIDYEDIAAAFEQIQSSVNSINETKVSLFVCGSGAWAHSNVWHSETLRTRIS